MLDTSKTVLSKTVFITLYQGETTICWGNQVKSIQTAPGPAERWTGATGQPASISWGGHCQSRQTVHPTPECQLPTSQKLLLWWVCSADWIWLPYNCPATMTSALVPCDVDIWIALIFCVLLHGVYALHVPYSKSVLLFAELYLVSDWVIWKHSYHRMKII